MEKGRTAVHKWQQLRTSADLLHVSAIATIAILHNCALQGSYALTNTTVTYEVRAG